MACGENMDVALFGEVLKRFVPLSAHDVSEILEHQAVSGRRFGEIALLLGLCRPQDVWQAWSAQLAGRPTPVDLDRVGVDTQALARLDRSLAHEFSAIPIRDLPNGIVIAVSEPALARAVEQLPRYLPKPAQFVPAEPSQIEAALRRHYPVGRSLDVNPRALPRDPAWTGPGPAQSAGASIESSPPSFAAGRTLHGSPN